VADKTLSKGRMKMKNKPQHEGSKKTPRSSDIKKSAKRTAPKDVKIEFFFSLQSNKIHITNLQRSPPSLPHLIIEMKVKSSAPGLLLLPRSSSLSVMSHLHTTRQATVILHMNKGNSVESQKYPRFKFNPQHVNDSSPIKLRY
jgi:hypothetical protein